MNFLFVGRYVMEGLRWSPDAARSVVKGHSNAVSALAFSRGGRRIVSRSWDNIVRAWDMPP